MRVIHILVKGIITVIGAGATEAVRIIGRNSKQTIFNIYAPFTDYISKINNTLEIMRQILML